MADRNSPRRRLDTQQGFSLVGLVVTLSIVVTLSGVAAIFYENVVEEQRRTIAANELDEYAKAVRAYILKTRQPLLASELNPIDPVEDVPGGYHMDFLVEEGLYREINRDPWDHLYRVDPETAVVYSLGPDPSDPSDDIKVPYARRVGGAGRNPFGDVLPNDDIPPVISGIQPVGVIKLSNPTVRASFYDHFGGTIDQNTAKMFIDQVDLTGDPGLTTDSAGQILFSTGGVFAEGNHTVVVQVADTAGNLARREWTFTVDTVPAIAKIHVPVQGSAIKGPLTPEIEASDDTLRKITVRLDFANVTNKVLGTAAADPQWLGQPPPQAGGGQNYWGTWSGLNTIDPAPNGIPDGTHYFTLLVEDFSGRVISDQSQFLVDNTKPGIQWVLAVDPLAQPPTGPTSPQVIATAVPHFEVRGWDNLQVANIWYEYRNISTGLIAGMRGSNAVTGPELMVPVDWNGDPAGDWGALFNSVEEIASTTANSGAGYTPVTLPEGEYEIHVWTEDLAQNDSKNPLAITTRFIVNLSADGLVGLVFLDMPSPQEPVGPIDLATRTISGLFGPPYPDAYSLTESTIQTRGHLRFTLLRFEFASTPMVAAIDDLTTDILGGWYGGKDGNYHLEPDGFFQDWEAVGTLPTVTGPTHITTDYVPYGNNPPGVNFSLRRNEGGQIPGGQYEARVEIPYVLSEKKTAWTTFYIDTEYPLIQGSSVLQVEGPPGTYNDLSAQAWTVDQLTLTSPPAILFGGQLEDRLCDPGLPPARLCDQSNARVVQVWARQDHAGPITDASGWELVFPLTGQQSSLIATYGAPATQAGAGPFRLTTSGPPTDLEGSHTIDLKAVDGAGHTTAWRSNVLVNALGPLVEFVRIENPQGGTPINLNLVTGPGATTIIEEPFVTIEIQATDEVDLDRIEYRIIEQGGPGTLGANIFPVPPGNQTYNTGDLSIFEDQLGSVFKPSPTSYTLEVFGVAGGKPGPLFTTTLVFQYLVDLAIFAPDYQGDAGGHMAMGQVEQAAIADYLVNNVDNVRSITVYDVDTRVSCTDCTVPADIGTWLSTRQVNGTTDVLVILDAMHEDMVGTGAPSSWGIETFMDGTDGNVVIFSGGTHPGARFHTTAGGIGDAGYSGGANEFRDAWTNLLDNSGSTKRRRPHADEIVAGEAVEVPTLKAKMLLPSLGVYRPEDLWGGALSNLGLLRGPSGTLEGGPYTVEERFTKNTDPLNQNKDIYRDDTGNAGDGHNETAGADQEGAAFVLQHSTDGGRFAVFYSHGDKNMDTGSTRPPVAAAGPVIEEFIEQYLTGVNQPDAVGAKVVFAAKPAGTRFIPGAYNATNEHDALIWPIFDGGQEKYRVLTDHESAGFFNTASKREVATVFDVMPDGSAYLVASKGQEDGEVSTVLDAMGVYLIRTDGTRIPLYRNNAAAARFADPVWGRLAENGSRAVVLGAAFQDPNPPPGYNFPVLGSNSALDPNAMVAWLYDLTQNPPVATQITTNFDGTLGTHEGTIRADLSGDGKIVALVTDTILTGTAPGSPVGNPLGSEKRVLLTYDVQGDFYDRVDDPGSSVQPSSHNCGANFYDNVEPVDVAISEDGQIIAWIARPAASAPAGCLGDQEQLLISKNISGTWRTGKITDCPAATDCEIGEGVTRLDIAHAGGAYPRVIFTTRGNLRGATIGGTSGSPEGASGAQPGGSSGPPPPPPGSEINDDLEFVPNNIAADDFGTVDYTGGTGWSGDWTETGDSGGGPPGSPGGRWNPLAADDLDGGIGACPAGTACEDFENPAFPTSGTGSWTASGWTVVTPAQQTIVPAAGCGSGQVHRYEGPKAAGWLNLVRTFSHSYYRPQGVVTAQMVCGSGNNCANKRLIFFEHDGGSWKLASEITDADGCGTVVFAMRPNTNQISIRDAGNGQGLDGNAVDWEAGDYAIVDGIYIRERPSKGCGIDMLCDDFASGYTNSGSGWSGNAWSGDTSRTSVQNSSTPECRDGNYLRFDKDFDNGREINRAAPAGFFSGAKELRASFWLEGDNAQGANEYVDFRAESTGSGWTPDLVHQFISDPCTYQDVALGFTDLKTVEFRNDTDNFDDDSNDYFYLDNVEIYDAAPPVGYGGGSGWAGSWLEQGEGGGAGICPLGYACEDLEGAYPGGGTGSWNGNWSESNGGHSNVAASACGSGTVHRIEGPDPGYQDFRRDITAPSGLTNPYYVFKGRVVCGSGNNCGNKVLNFHENNGSTWVDFGDVKESEGCQQIAVPIRNDTTITVLRPGRTGDGNGWAAFEAGDYVEVDEMYVRDGPPTEGWWIYAQDDFGCSSEYTCGQGNWNGNWIDEEDGSDSSGVWRGGTPGPNPGCMPDKWLGNNDGDAVPHDDKRMSRGLGNLTGLAGKTVRIKFSAWYRCAGNCSGTTGYQFQISPNGNTTANYVDRVLIDDGTQTVDQCHLYTYTLSPADLGSDTYIRFRGRSGNSSDNDIRIDDVRVEVFEGTPAAGSNPGAGDIQQVRGGAATACRGDGHIALTDTSGGATIERMFAAAVGAGGARLSFNRSFGSFLDGDDRFYLDYNDGAVWQTLVTWSGGLGAAACQREYWDLPAGATGIRLRGANNEPADVLYIDDLLVEEYVPAAGCGATRVCEDWATGTYSGNTGGWSGSWTWGGGNDGTFLQGGVTTPYAEDVYLEIGDAFDTNDSLYRQVTNGFFGAAAGLTVRIGIDNPASASSTLRVEADEWGGGTSVLGTIAPGFSGSQTFPVPFGNIQTLRIINQNNIPVTESIRIDNIDIYPPSQPHTGGDMQAGSPSTCGGGGFLQLVNLSGTGVVACPPNAICDDLESGSMSGGTPTVGPGPYWTSNWIENGESDGIGAGRMTIVNNDGTGSCRDSWHLHMNDIDGSGKFWERRFDLAGMSSPEISFDVSGENLESGDQVRVWEYDGGWNGPLQTWTGPVACQRVTVPISGSATRVAFDSNFNWSTTDDSHIDNIVIEASGSPPPGPSTPGPDIERLFPALTMSGVVSFDREFTGFDGAPKGISLEYTTNGGTTWINVNTWSDTTGDQTCRRESFPVPVGTNGIRFIGTGFNTLSDTMTVDNLSVDEVDPYDTGDPTWGGPWVEGNDDGDPFAGWIRSESNVSCFSTNHILLTDAGGAEAGQYIERDVDLSGFTNPWIELSRTVGASSLNHDDPNNESVELKVWNGSGWNTVKTWWNFDGTGWPRTCTLEQFGLGTSSASAKVRFEVRGTAWEAADEFRIDDIRIYEGPACPGGGDICDDFSSGGYGGGSGWAGAWVEENDTNGAAGGEIFVDNNSLPDCRDGDYLSFQELDQNGGNLRVKREMDAAIMGGMTNPYVEFDMQFACASECDEALMLEASDDGSTWQYYFRWKPDGATGCQHFEVPIPQSSRWIRFGPEWDGRWDNDDWAYVDNVKIVNRTGSSPFSCDPGDICEDWNSNDYTSGQGWSNNWSGDTDKTSLQSGSGTNCREGARGVRFDDDFDDNDDITRDWGIIGGATDLRVGFWFQISGPDLDEDMEVRIEQNNSGTYNVFHRIEGQESSCFFVDLDIPEDATGIRFQQNQNLDGSEYWYMDQLVVYDAGPPPAGSGGCGVTQICEDFSSGDNSGGQGWNGAWTGNFGSYDRWSVQNSSNPLCRDGDHLEAADPDARDARRQVTASLFDSFSSPTISFYWGWGVQDGDTNDDMGFWVTDTPGSGWVLMATLNSGDACRNEVIDLSPGNTGLGGPVREIRFVRDNGDNHEGNDTIWFDNITIYDAGGGGGTGDLHSQRGVYMWLGNFGGGGNQFVHLVDPVGGPAHHPRISPDGNTFVFEVDAQEIHGLFGWDPADLDPSTRRLEQTVDVTAGGTLGGSWGGDPRKVVRGRFQGSPNPQMGYSSILQVVAPLDDQGSGTVPLLPFAPTFTATNPFAGWNLPVCTN